MLFFGLIYDVQRTNNRLYMRTKQHLTTMYNNQSYTLTEMLLYIDECLNLN